MKKISKISVLGLVGGSVIVADNVFNVGSHSAWALTQDTNDEIEQRKRAGSLAAILSYLLDEDSQANSDSYVTPQNTQLDITAQLGVLINDSDVPGRFVSLLQDAQNGLLNLSADGSFTYLPDIDFTGIDSFVYQLAGANGVIGEATVTIKVNGIPDAIDDNFSFDGSSPFIGDVVTNVVGGSDIIVDGAQVIEVVNEATTLGGQVSIQANGDFEYIPPSNLGGQQDSFVYTLQDTDGETDTATVTWQVAIGISGIELPQSIIEDSVLNAQLTLIAPGELEYLEVNTTQFSLSDLANVAITPLTPIVGTYGTFSITGFDMSTGVLSYRYDPTGTNQDHMGALNDVLRDTISLVVKDTSRPDTASFSLNIDVTDTNPIANNDQRSISEGTSAIAGNAVGIPGSATGDEQDTLIDPNATPVTDVGFGGTDGTVGTGLAGSYGNFVINSAGVYTYTLDNTNSNVQGLKGGESLTDVFTYTITDGDGDTDTANVTVTINGVEDALPTIDIPDNNGGAVGDISVAENSNLSGRTLTIASTAGLATSTALTITNEAGSVRTITLAELQDLTSTPITINGSDGDLELTGFNSSTGVLTYSYDPTGTSRDHSAGLESIVEQFTLVVTDNEADSSTDVLDILVQDLPVTALNDTNNILEDEAPNTKSGALLGNDTLSSETPVEITKVTFGVTDLVLGTEFNSQYGGLTVNAAGNYTYELDNSNASVQALNDGQSLSEVFTYTLSDTDSSDTATLTITINGDTDIPVVTIPNDGLGAAGSDLSVVENLTVNGTFNIASDGGLANTGTALSVTVDSNTTTLALAQLNGLASANVVITAGGDGNLTLTNYDSSAGTVSYQFDPSGTNSDHSGGNNSVIENYIISVIDDDGQTSLAKALDMLVTDTNPTANDDQRSISEGTSAIAGNAVSIPGSATGDVQDTVIDPVTLTDIDFGATDGTVGTGLTGNYGNFVISSLGVYTYTLDNTNSNVQGLKAGESLAEVFTYTITDNEGPNADTDTANVTVTINGVEDALPTIGIPDNNGGAVGDISVAENSNLSSRTLTIASTAGLATNTALTITNEAGSVRTITLAELQDLTSTPITINGSDGDLELTGFNSSTGVLTYSYDPTGTSRDHSAGPDSIVEQFTLSVTDTEADSATDVLDILIEDLPVTALDDTNNILEDEAPNTKSGALLGNDTLSSETPVEITKVTFGVTDLVLGTEFNSQYGGLTVNAAGNYTYELDNSNASVQALNDGQSLSEVFTYTLSDTDSSDTATLTITINGDTDIPVVTIPNDGLGAAGSDLSVVENLTVNGTFNVASDGGLATTGTALSVTVDGGITNLTLAQLNGLASTNVVITAGGDGNLTLTNYDSSAGTVSYQFDPSGTNRDHSGGDNSVIENYIISVIDDDGQTSLAKALDILVTDTNPTANDDQRSISEGTSAIAGNAVGIPGSATGDAQDTFFDSITVTDIDFGATDGTVGTGLTGNYGNFVISSLGVYTYTLDNTNSNVQGLKAGESLAEVFTYTITDNEGPNADTDTANVTVTINGVEDALPTIGIPDNNGGAVGDISVAENSNLSGRTLTIASTAGLATSTALTITNEAGSVRTITLAELQDLTSTPITINGSDGDLQLAGFNSSTGVLTYSYDPTGTSRDHSAGDLSVIEEFNLRVEDVEGDSNTNTLDILITDTAPTAAIDTNTIDEGDILVTGNVLTNDTQGADTAASVAGVAFMTTPEVVGVPFTSEFGQIDINADGTYTYTLDNGNTSVAGLDPGDSLTEVFTYTIADTDGDTSSTTLTVTIDGI